MSVMTDQKAKDGSGTNDASQKRTSWMTIEETAEETARMKCLNRLENFSEVLK